MRIAILGCGSIGTIVGAMLTKNGLNVTMIDGYQKHVEALNKKGATIIGTIDMNVPVIACNLDNIDGVYDVVIYMAKGPNNEEYLTKILPHINEDSVVCTLQNGLPEEDVVKYIGIDRVISGIVGWGASLKGPGVSVMTSHLGEKQNYEIGELDGSISPRLKIVCDILNNAGVCKITDKLINLRWTKLAINASFSGMSAALGCEYGDIIDNEHALLCAAFVKDEVIKVAHAQNISLLQYNGVNFENFELINGMDSFSEVKEYYDQWYSVHRKVIASMLFDLRLGRKSEIKAINGIVCAKGKALGIQTPFNDKVVELVQESENNKKVNIFSNLVRFSPLLDNFKLGKYNMKNIFVNLSDKEKKDLVQKASDLGYQNERNFGNCPQSTIAAIQDVFGLIDDNTFKQAYGLGAGVGLTSKGTCGALAAGVMIISSLQGREKLDFKSGMNKKCYELSKNLLDKVESYYGGILCYEIQNKIMGNSFDLNKQEEVKAFEEAGGHDDKCPSVIRVVTEFIGEMIVNGEI